MHICAGGPRMCLAHSQTKHRFHTLEMGGAGRSTFTSLSFSLSLPVTPVVISTAPHPLPTPAAPPARAPVYTGKRAPAPSRDKARLPVRAGRQGASPPPGQLPYPVGAPINVTEFLYNGVVGVPGAGIGVIGFTSLTNFVVSDTQVEFFTLLGCVFSFRTQPSTTGTASFGLVAEVGRAPCVQNQVWPSKKKKASPAFEKKPAQRLRPARRAPCSAASP